MGSSTYAAFLLLVGGVSYIIGRKRALDVAHAHQKHLHSAPWYYGVYTALWAVSPPLLVTLVWFAVQVPFQFHTFSWALLLSSVVGLWHARQKITPTFAARSFIEKGIYGLFLLCAALVVLVTFSIALSMIAETVRFFQVVPFKDFFFGLRWSPGATRLDVQTGYFGALPLFAGTFMVTLIAMVLAIPVGLFSAIYLSEYANPRVRSFLKPFLEVLAGIPTVVYGFFALIVIIPFLQYLGDLLGLNIAAESALGVGLVIGIMIVPYIASLSDDILNSVPKALREGSLALGATTSEGIKKVILPAAFPGIMASILLATSRAIGETMVVVMAAGYSARLTFSPFEAVTTVTVQIVSLLTGDQEFNSPKTLAAFALGLTLFFITLILNMIALRIVHHYREKYE